MAATAGLTAARCDLTFSNPGETRYADCPFLGGNRLTRDNLVNSAFDEVYVSDDLSQLVNFARGSHTQDWDYDALGNWNSVTTNVGTPETRTHDAQNQITSISSATTPAYDFNGNMTGDDVGRGFVYNAWNRLVEVKSGSTVLKTYRYDGLNRRVSADDGTDVTDLYSSNQWQVLEERVNGNVYAHYVWSPMYVDAMILRDRSVGGGTLNERLYVVQDSNFNIVALVNTSGNVVERYAYTPFGVRTVMDASWTVIGSSAYDFEHGFQGMRYDTIARMNAAHHRWYSPTLGRWVQTDPIMFAGGDNNLYGFVANGPTRATDPSGLQKMYDTTPRVVDKDGNPVPMRRDDTIGGTPLVAGERTDGHRVRVNGKVIGQLEISGDFELVAGYEARLSRYVGEAVDRIATVNHFIQKHWNCLETVAKKRGMPVSKQCY